MLIPWRIKNRMEKSRSALAFYINRLFKNRNKNAKKSILFYCTYKGKSGGSIAVAEIAKLLSQNYYIYFFTDSTNPLNQLYSESATFIKSLVGMQFDIILCDDTTSARKIEQLRSYAPTLIVSCHCLRDSCHGRLPDDMVETLNAADHVHFVDACQQDSFLLEKHKYFIIPNIVPKVEKRKFTENVGSVGDLDQERKNLDEVVRIFEKSHAKKLHLWRTSRKFGNSKIISHENWETSKSKIYNSFDVLLFPSKSETFGLVIAEALSAGVPCVISSIPAFKQYKECEGVFQLQDSTTYEEISKVINGFMSNPDIREACIEFWETRFSKQIVSELWLEALDTLTIDSE